MIQQEWQEANRRSWNVATRQHNSHKGDQAAFLREGGSTLFPEEIALLGDTAGKSLVHLQCNAGQDTLSIAAQLGATVTGVDISDEAIDFARKLSAGSGIPGTFIRSDLFEWFQNNRTLYDLVFISYGALVWLPDIMAWGRGVASALKPGGRLVLLEFHPLVGVMFGPMSGDWAEATDYMGGGQYTYQEGVGDYVALSGEGLTPMAKDGPADNGQEFKNSNPCHEFAWGLADVTTALLQAGLRLTTMREYPYSNGWKPFEQMVERPGRRMVWPDHLPQMPLMYGLCAEK
jgi:SAM-dependent methyltransferase